MNDKNAKIDIQGLLLDNNFKYATKLGQETNLLQVMGVNEVQLSKLIAWLLNKNQGHGLGIKFFNCLLKQAYIQYKQQLNQSTGFLKHDFFEDNYWSTQFSYDCFTPSIVQTEVSCGEAGRIDLVITDLADDLIVVIENKFTAAQTGNQLERYSQFIEENSPKDANVIPIYLDFAGRWDGSETAPEWIKMDYGFIEEFLKESINDVSKEYQLPLIQFYNYLTDDYEIVLGDKLEEYDQALIKLTEKHLQTIRVMQSIGNETYSPFAGYHETKESLLTYQANKEAFDELSQYSFKDIIKKFAIHHFGSDVIFETDHERAKSVYWFKTSWVNQSKDDCFLWVNAFFGEHMFLQVCFDEELCSHLSLRELPEGFKQYKDYIKSPKFSFTVFDMQTLVSALGFADKASESLFKALEINNENSDSK